jgi:hypothetical protein
MAGRLAREDREGLAQEIRKLQELADERGVELTKFKSDAPVNIKIRKLVTDFLAMVAEKPQVMAMLRRVPVLREWFASLASLIGVKLDFGPTTKTDALVPVTVEFGTAKSPPEKAGNAKKSALVHPELVVDPGIGN